MTRRMSATEVKASFLSLLDEVETGEVIEITRHGLAVARLAPVRGPHALKGRLAGIAKTAADGDDLFATGMNWHLT